MITNNNKWVYEFLSCSAASEISTEDTIKAHKASVLYADEYCSHRITVRRGHIIDDTKISLHSFDEKKHIHVRFVGEAAVDQGGPRREFLCSL